MNEITKNLLSQKPGLQKTIEAHGSKTLAQYSDLLDKIPADMSQVLLQTIQNCSSDYSIDVAKNITKDYLLHTADHLGILNHPFFWCSKITSKPTKQVIVLATSNISPTNSSYPRGLYWHNSELKHVRAPLLPLSYRRFALYGVTALSTEKYQLWLENFNTVPEIKKILVKICADKRLYRVSWFSEQLTLINHAWWQEIFGTDNLIYLELEEIVNNLISDGIQQKDSSIYKILFDTKVRNNYISYFDGVSGAHRSNPKTGSQLFWLLDHEKLTRHSLTLNEDELQDEQGSSIKLTPEEVIKRLHNRTLLPTLALSYSIIAFDNNATLTGGFSQIDYLGDMAEAWKKVFPVKSTPPTSIFNGEFSIHDVTDNKKSVPATLCDLIQAIPTQKMRLSYVNNVQNKMTLLQAIDAMAQDLLRIVDKTNEQK